MNDLETGQCRLGLLTIDVYMTQELLSNEKYSLFGFTLESTVNKTVSNTLKLQKLYDLS